MKRIYHSEDAPCKDCQSEIKEIGCHAVCAAYISYRKKMETEKANRKQKREISEAMYWLSQRRHGR